MRFGDSRVQALAGALCQTMGAVTGITNRSLRVLMTGLLGTPYSMTQVGYDLARLTRNGLITRRSHANTYDLTPDGLKFAIFYTKVHDRVLTPLFAAGSPRPRLSSAPLSRHRATHRHPARRSQAARNSLPKTCANWADALWDAVGSVTRTVPGGQGLSSGWRAMIFGLWA
jgi:hypothetical protein